MDHPFDLNNSVFSVNTGKDLLKFFELAEESIREGKGSLKIDGANASFKLVTREDGTKEFVGDRYSLHPIDIEGITANNASERFKPQLDRETGEPKPHGMIRTYTNLLRIMNEALPYITEELQIIGAYDNSTLIFNTEYVEGQTNLLDYDHDFLAIHNLGQIYEKKSKKGYRPGAERPLKMDPKTRELKPVKDFAEGIDLNSDQDGALKKLVEKVGIVAQKHGFKIYGDVPVKFKTEDKKAALEKGEGEGEGEEEKTAKINLDKPLAQQITVVWDRSMVGVKKEGPKPIEKSDFKSLLEKSINPWDKEVVLKEPRRTVRALSKEVYLAFAQKMDESGVTTVDYSEYLYAPLGVAGAAEQGKLALDGGIFWHATRMLGIEFLKALTSGMGGADKHEGVVLRDKERFGVDMVKISGNFIVEGMASPHRKEEAPIAGAEVEKMKCGRTIALIPGGYKPPHKGHLAMAEHYAKIANIVYIFIGATARPKKEEKDQFNVDARASQNIWNLYIKSAGLNNVKTMIATEGEDEGSPISYMFELIGQDLNPLWAAARAEEEGKPKAAGAGEGRKKIFKLKDCIILGASTKLAPVKPRKRKLKKGQEQKKKKAVSDIERYHRGDLEDTLKAVHDVTPDMAELLEPSVYKYELKEGENLQATDFRKILHIIAIGNGHVKIGPEPEPGKPDARETTYDLLKKFIPGTPGENQAMADQVLAILGLSPEPEIELEPPPEERPEPEEKAPEVEPQEDESEVRSENKKKGVLSSILYGLIEEVLYEQTEPYQLKVRAKHSRMKARLISKGKNKHFGGGKGHKRPSTKRTKSAPPIGENSADKEELVEGMPDYWTRREMEGIATFITTKFSALISDADFRGRDPTREEKKLLGSIITLQTSIPQLIKDRHHGKREYDLESITSWWIEVLSPWLKEMRKLQSYEDKLKQVMAQDMVDFGNILAKEFKKHDPHMAPFSDAPAGLAIPKELDVVWREHEERIKKKIEEMSVASGAGGAYEAGAGSTFMKKRGKPSAKKKKKRRKEEKNEQFVNDVLDYLLEKWESN